MGGWGFCFTTRLRLGPKGTGFSNVTPLVVVAYLSHLETVVWDRLSPSITIYPWHLDNPSCHHRYPHPHHGVDQGTVPIPLPFTSLCDIGRFGEKLAEASHVPAERRSPRRLFLLFCPERLVGVGERGATRWERDARRGQGETEEEEERVERMGVGDRGRRWERPGSTRQGGVARQGGRGRGDPGRECGTVER